MPLTDDLRDLTTALPKSVEGRFLLAISHLRRLEFTTALTYFRETLDLEPRHDEALRNDVVVQRYLDRPYLIEGRKGHCRICCLVTSAEPLRAYVYSEGIVRIAPEPYDRDPGKAGHPEMHVTNTALHLDHPGLSIYQDPAQEDTGSIRSLSALLGRMTADGLEGQAVFGEIKQLVEWFVRLLAAEGLFARQAASDPARGFRPWSAAR